MISIIIPAYNAANTLRPCLYALQKQHPLPEPIEVIVVNDGSTDQTAQIAKNAGVKVVNQANAGAAAARNHGAKVASGNLLLFTDADCIPATDWVAQMIAPFNNAAVAGAKGIYTTTQTALTPRFVQQEYEHKYDRLKNQSTIDFIDTYSAAYRRDIFLAMGGFDPTFPGASVEDQEFSFRLAEAGYQLVFVPLAKVTHCHDLNLKEYARRKYFIGYWKPLVMWRYPNKLTHDSHTPQTIKLQMGLAALGAFFFLLATIQRKKKWTWAGVTSWGIQILSGLPFYKKIWHRDPAVCVIAPLLIVVRAWALGVGFLWGTIRLLINAYIHDKK